MSWIYLVEVAGGTLWRAFSEENATLALAMRKRTSAEELLAASNRFEPNIPRQEAARLLREAYDVVSPILDKRKWIDFPKLWKVPYLEEAWRVKFRELETRHLMGTDISEMLKTAADRFTSCYRELAANVGPKPSPSSYNQYSRRFEPGGTYTISGDEKAMARVAESRARYDEAWRQLCAATSPSAAAANA